MDCNLQLCPQNVQLGLVEAKALDVDYLTYKLGEQLRADGKTPELDDSGKVKISLNISWFSINMQSPLHIS